MAGCERCPAPASRNNNDEDDKSILPWELPQVPLEKELFKCLKKVSTGEKLPARCLLEGVPLYEGLKHKAEDHNDQQ